MSEYIVDALWMAEYERGIESLLGIKLEYDGNDNPTPPLPRRNIIVRCRDCKHGREHNMRAYGGRRDQLLCHHFSMSSGAGWPVEPDGFCAWGSREDV